MTMLDWQVFMEYQFMNYKRMLSISAMSATGLALAILTTGCELYSPNRASFPNNSSENGTNYPSSENGTNYPSSGSETNYPSSENGTNYPSSQRDINQDSERMSYLNLTNSQRSQINRIREESDARILELLSDEQRQEVQNNNYGRNNNGRNQLSMRKLRSLNLSTEQRQSISEITRNQQEQIQEILTPEQRQMMQQRRRSTRGNRNYRNNGENENTSY